METATEEPDVDAGTSHQTKYDCPHCEKTFTLKTNQLRHIRTQHDGKMAFKCEQCLKEFRRSDKLREHKCRYKCTQCDQTFRDPVTLTLHLSLCSAGKCRSCNKVFKTGWELVRHEKVCSAKNCELCDVRVSSLVEHQKICPKLNCPHCHRHSKNIERLRTHMRLCRKQKYSCRRCKKEFTSSATFRDHIKACTKFRCQKCEIDFDDYESYATHKDTHKKRTTAESRRRISTWRCRFENCNETFQNRSDLHRHQTNAHIDPNREMNWPEGREPWVRKGSVDEKCRDVCIDNRAHIFKNHDHREIKSLYNFTFMTDGWYEELRHYLDRVREGTAEAVKVNITLGFLLKNKQTGELRYFVPGDNFPLLTHPLRIDRMSGWSQLYSLATLERLTDYIKEHRPNTQWELVSVLNANIEVTNLNVNMGIGDIPDYIKNSNCIRSLIHDRYKHEYTDNNCAVRALAYHQLSKNDPKTYGSGKTVTDGELNDLTNELAATWGKEGVDLSEIGEFEKCFDLDVDIFALQSDSSVIPIYTTKGKRGSNRITLNLYNTHLSYVTNPRGYLQKFSCESCQRHFLLLGDLKRHRGTCTRASRKVFKFAHYKPSKTIFEKLECERIFVPKNQRRHGLFATFDCEAMLKDTPKIEILPKLERTRYTKEHKVVSMSVCSNVENYREAQCFIDINPQTLINDAVRYLQEISEVGAAQIRNRWKDVIEKLDKRIEEASDEPADEDMEDEDMEDDDVQHLVTDSIDATENPHTPKQRLKRLKKEFLNYCDTLPVLGYNSASYDLNLIKAYLFPALGIGEYTRIQFHTDTYEDLPVVTVESCPRSDNTTVLPPDPYAYVIKKNNSYTAVYANCLKFLDALLFQPPGLSYANYLKAYEVPACKGSMCYEWLDDFAKLSYPELPAYETFYSELKRVNVLDDGEGEEAGRQRWRELKTTWEEKGWTSFREYLVWYNNLDVEPFVVAVERMQAVYWEEGIDILKSAISIPGISRQLLFQAAQKQNISFASILGQDEDLYHTLKAHLIGGPSIIFHREHSRGRTLLYGLDGNLCAIIVGYDAAALYLCCLDQNMPCGGYVRRFGPDFEPIPRLYRKDMFDWMDYTAHTQNITIWHDRNHGEVKINKYKVDGYCVETDTVYEYNGCYYHGCKRCEKRHKKVDAETWEKNRKNTEEKVRGLKKFHKGKLVIITEHEYHDLLDSAKGAPRFNAEDIKAGKGKLNLFDFVQERLPPFYRAHGHGSRTEHTILKAVQSGLLYGMVEVDIEVPQDKYDQFKEMSPLFCSVDIPFGDIGEHMQGYVEKQGLSQKPRRLLVGGMKATKFLVLSDLLKWYLDHGLVVTKVHQVIEFKPQRCFRPFVKYVSDSRRAGDADPALKPRADGSKIVGNAGYGSLIMNTEKHQDTKYYNDDTRVQLLVNNPRYKTMTHITDKLKEVTLSKRQVNCDLPIQLGYAVLQLAKMRMLSFYYDFLQKQCTPKCFQLTEMDTDSLYMALSGPDLPSVLKSDSHRAKFHEDRCNHCNDLPYGPEQGFFFPRECCQKHTKYDNRTPGLFKMEASGVEMISLCSKTYSLKTESGGCKFSSKGLNKNALADPHAAFKQVLETGIPQSGVNRGFRAHGGTVFTYEQERTALGYFYCKRQVASDGRSTRPLPTTLTIWSDQKLDIVADDRHPLWPDKIHNFNIDSNTYSTLSDVCVAATNLDNPDELVRKACEQMPAYKPLGDLVFVADGGFAKINHRDNFTYLWTSGVDVRTARLLSSDKRPGANRLAEIWNNMSSTMLVSDDDSDAT